MLIKWRESLKAGSVRRNILTIFFTQAVTVGLGLLLNLVIARALGPDDKGVLDLFRLLTTFISELGMLGMGSSLMYFFVNKKIPFSTVHGTGFAYALLAGGFTLLIGIIGQSLWAHLFNGLLPWMLILAFALAPFIYYRNIWASLVLGLDNPSVNFRVSLAVTIANLIFVFALIGLQSINSDALIWVTTVLMIAPALFGFFHFNRIDPNRQVDVSLANTALKRGFIIYVGAVANTLHFRIDQVMLGVFFDTRAVGLYALSVRLAELILLFDTPIAAATLKKVGTLSREKSYSLSRKIALLQLIISGGVGIIAMLLIQPFITFVLPDYIESITPLMILIPGVVMWSVSRHLSHYIVYNVGNANLTTYFAIFGVLLNTGLNFLLIPLMGIQGAALASAASYIMIFFAVLISFLRLKPKI